jgi:hypothetical protein
MGDGVTPDKSESKLIHTFSFCCDVGKNITGCGKAYLTFNPFPGGTKTISLSELLNVCDKGTLVYGIISNPIENIISLSGSNLIINNFEAIKTP